MPMTDNLEMQPSAWRRSAQPASALADALNVRPPARAASWPALGFLAVVVTLAATVGLSSLGHDSLCHTEAWRANWCFEGGFDHARRFPPLQFLMGWGIQHYVGRTEAILRLPYALAGIFCVVLVYGLCRRWTGVAAGLLAAAVAATHPVLLYYSQRQKEFSLEAMMTAALLWGGWETYRRRSTAALIGFVALSLVGLGLTFTSSLVIAAWLPVLGWTYLQSAAYQRRSTPVFLTAAGVLLVAGLGWYLWLAGCPNRDVYAHYYDVVEVAWPTGYAPRALAAWLGSALYGAAHFVLGMSDIWAPLNWLIGGFELLTVAASVSVLWRKCRPLCCVVALLLLATILAGAMRLWPLGNLRHTSFLIPIACVAIGCGLSELIRRLGASPATVLLLAVCVFIPSVRAVRATVTAPRTYEHLRPVMQYVIAHRQADDALFVHYFANDAFEFYWPALDMPLLIQPSVDRQNLPAFATRFDDWLTLHPRVWFIFSHNWKDERREWIGHLERNYAVVDEFQAGEASAHLLSRKNHIE